MSVQSNNQGRAYEYICLLTLNEEINKILINFNVLVRLHRGLFKFIHNFLII